MDRWSKSTERRKVAMTRDVGTVHLRMPYNDYMSFVSAIDALPRPDAVDALRKLLASPSPWRSRPTE